MNRGAGGWSPWLQVLFIALLFVGMLATLWRTVDSRASTGPAIERRAAELLAAYRPAGGLDLSQPSVVLANWDGPAVASSNCDEWRISIHRGVADVLSTAALDDLLAHELAHLIECAETGRSAGHGPAWWRRYDTLRQLT